MNLALIRVMDFLLNAPETKHIVVWGNGQLGKAIVEMVEQQLPHIEEINIIDSSIEDSQSECDTTVLPINALESLTCDCLIIGSIAYESEILNTVEQRFPTLRSRVFCLSDPLSQNNSQLSLTLRHSREELTSLVFAYPDCPEVWRALAKTASGEERDYYLRCAAILSS